MKPTLALLIALATPAQAFDLAWPLDCTLGETCFIQHYVDRDPGPAATDFTGGTPTYDGHDGTDIAIPDRAAMAAGVTVLAAAPGIVLGTRDGVPDFAPYPPGKECGNGVVVDDGNGWQTQYCHLKQGSVTVRKGQRITTGTPLGQVGQSGMAEFPHLHLTVRQGKTPVDPFAPASIPRPVDTGPGLQIAAPLWATPIPYDGGGFLAAGISGETHAYDALHDATPPPPITQSSRFITLWVYGYGGRQGDVLTYHLTDPKGRPVLDGQDTLTKPQDRIARYLAKPKPATLPPGQYTARIDWHRNGVLLDQITTEMVLAP